MSLFSFCFDNLTISESGMKSPTIIVWGLMCVLSFSKVSFMNVGALTFGVNVKNGDFLLVDFPFDDYEVFFFITFDDFWFKICFI